MNDSKYCEVNAIIHILRIKETNAFEKPGAFLRVMRED